MPVFSLLGLSSFDTNHGSRHGISFSLFRAKFSVASFLRSLLVSGPCATVFKNNTLFPAICPDKLVNFSNTHRGYAKACAADDFELSLHAENGQVEVFDSYRNPNFQPYNHIQIPSEDFKSSQDGHFYNPTGDFGQAMGHAQLMPSHDNTDNSGSSHHSSQSFFKEEEEMHFHSGHHHDIFNRAQCLNNFMPRDIPIEHQSHFAINAYGINANHAFTDFRPQSFNDCSSYGSSLGSFDSPLDDLLFSGPPMQPEVPLIMAPEQRKRKAHMQDFAMPEELHDNQAAPKRLKRESIDTLSDSIETRSVYSDAKHVTNENKFDVESGNKGRFACKECNASFKVKSYLTRHMKKHTNSKAFVCPFFNNSEAMGTEISNKCHTNGGFSRKDTYTTHMKALHFVYPPRTKSSQRNMSGGRCTGCFEYFDNNASWLKNHIEAYLCPGLSDTSSKEPISVKQESSD